MTSEASSTNGTPWMPLFGGVVVGALAWAGLNLWFAHPFIATTQDLPTVFKEPPQLSPAAAAAIAAAAPAGPTDPGEATYSTVCSACHQATGQGLAGAFPPLAGSEWVSADPETPIRIVIAGLSGPITVKGAPFNSMMPPPAGMDDEKIAAVLTYVRSHFDNKAEPVTKEKVAEVRASLNGRTAPWTAEELTKLRK
jgi:mono/diheme cytochrome c family protein